jgi:hypothetical protein
LTHKDFLKSTADMALAKLGYGGRDTPQPQAHNQQNNFFIIAQDDLARAREKLLNPGGFPQLAKD